METNNSATKAPGGNLPTRVLYWLDRRTGVVGLVRTMADEHIPGGARFAYVFGSGLLFIFLLQAVTGVCLAFYYTPTAETAHTSVAYITKQVVCGGFLRSLHSYGASAMMIVLGLHFLQTFFFGAFKGRRELVWMSGALLSLMVLGMGFTGYLLPWDQKAYFATAVGTNIMGQAPFVGTLLSRVIRGGDSIGTLTLSRFYVAHVFLIPATIFLFIGAHVLLFRKAGPAGPVREHPVSPTLTADHFYPRQVLMDMAFALLIMAAISGLSYFQPATLGPVANPADTHFLPRPEWYYLPMFEWLKFWEGPLVVVGVMVVPGLLAITFFLMPFIDRGLERRPWRRPIPALAVSFVVLGMIYLGVRSRIEDRNNPEIAAQLDLQRQQENTYSTAPFEPYLEPSAGASVTGAHPWPADPLVALGKGVFSTRGCNGCHGSAGLGTAAAPALVGVTRKFQTNALVALLHNPSAKMRAGRMPVVDAAPDEMSALISYLGVLGTTAANVPPVFSFANRNPAIGRVANGPLHLGEGRVSVTSPRTASSEPAIYALAGQQFFQQRGCFVCHGEAGTGGRAPALAPLIAGVPDAQLVMLLKNPNRKMRDGGMPFVEASSEEIRSLLLYLRSLSRPLPVRQPLVTRSQSEGPMNPQSSLLVADGAAAGNPYPQTLQNIPNGRDSGVPSASAQNSAGRALFLSHGCIACHGVKAQGTRIAPSLVGVGSRYPGDNLASLLHHPTEKMRAGGMPMVEIDDAQMAELTAYLISLQPASQASTVVPSRIEAPAPAP